MNDAVGRSIFRPLPPNPSVALHVRKLLPLADFQSSGCMFAPSPAPCAEANWARSIALDFICLDRPPGVKIILVDDVTTC